MVGTKLLGKRKWRENQQSSWIWLDEEPSIDPFASPIIDWICQDNDVNDTEQGENQRKNEVVWRTRRYVWKICGSKSKGVGATDPIFL